MIHACSPSPLSVFVFVWVCECLVRVGGTGKDGSGVELIMVSDLKGSPSPVPKVVWVGTECECDLEPWDFFFRFGGASGERRLGVPGGDLHGDGGLSCVVIGEGARMRRRGCLPFAAGESQGEGVCVIAKSTVVGPWVWELVCIGLWSELGMHQTPIWM